MKSAVAVLILASMSLVLHAQDKDKPAWKKFTSREGGFNVLMPGTPVLKKETAQTPVGQITAVLYSLEQIAGAANYTVSYADLPDTLADVGALVGTDVIIDLLLTNARDAAAAKLNGKVIKDEKVMLEKRFPGREFRLQTEVGIFRFRVYLVGARVFQVVAAGPKEFATDKYADKFFESFKLGR